MTTIDTNMSLVMIDPNEPLELYDGTIIKGRLEWFLYALCCLDYGNLPTPLSRIEEWANALITNELPNMETQSRAEEFFKAILTGDTSNLPTPQSRSEVLLDKLARGENDFTNVEKIQSRYEFLLAYLIKNGGGIGNIDYVLYKFQKEDETLYNTKERPVKSAILKGNTLVNILSTCINKPLTKTTHSNHIQFLKPLESGKEYTVIISLSNAVTTTDAKVLNIRGNKIDGGYSSIYDAVFKITNGIQKVKFTPTDSFVTCLVAIAGNALEDTSVTMDYLMFIEGDYTNVDIPYFEGMQSVKMPVLTTTGKNLLKDDLWESGCINVDTGINETSVNRSRYNDFIPINTGDVFSFSSSTNVWRKYFLYDSNKNFLQTFPAVLTKNLTINIENTQAKYMRIWIQQDINTLDNDIQLERGTVTTSYEPYKSNILTVNEEVELRGIGDVKDTLDLTTGELTQSIGEIVLDGVSTHLYDSQVGGNEALTYRVMTDMFVKDGAPQCLVDTFPSNVGDHHGDGIEGVRIIGNRLYLYIYKTRLSNPSRSGVMEYLKSNPMKVQYPMSQEVVKTVDLSIVDQGGATIPKLKTFDKITHVNVSATDILPEVEMEVATTIGEDLSGTLYSTMEDIETKQEALKESNNAQTESVNSTMMATTEIYESLL